MPKQTDSVEDHYTTGGLMERLQKAAESSGLDWTNLSPEDLAPIDQFHIRGRTATLEMIELTKFSEENKVLDIGCGIGGPARTLAAETGCQVHGIDLIEEFIDVATKITELTKQTDKVTFSSCNALQLPFEDDSFDGAWMQHVNMNIPNKAELLAEISRVLKPKGTFAFHEILTDKADSPHFPVPWATTKEENSLVTEESFRSLLEGAGFSVTNWVDHTEGSRLWFEAIFEKAKAGKTPQLNLNVLMGDRFPTMARNIHQSLAENRVKIVMAVSSKN